MKILFTLLLLISIGSYAQDKLLGILPLQDGQVVYTDVLPAENISKQDAYKRARRWVVKNYKSAKDVIQNDESGEEITVKGIATFNWQVTFYGSVPLDVRHTLTLQFKDGRYRYEMSQFSASGSGPFIPIEQWNKGRDKNSQKVFLEINDWVDKTIKSLHSYIISPPKRRLVEALVKVVGKQ